MKILYKVHLACLLFHTDSRDNLQNIVYNLILIVQKMLFCKVLSTVEVLDNLEIFIFSVLHLRFIHFDIDI